MRRTLACLLFVSAAAGQNGGKGVVPRQADPLSFVNEKKLALVIGINDYPEESGLSKLKWAVKDASDLAAELQRQGYTVDPLLNERVTKVAIRKHLTDMLKRLDPNAGTIVFAFSGHGGQVGREQYLATYESSADDLDKTGASVEEIRTLLEDSGAPRKMMFLDACRNVSTPGAKDSAAPIEPMLELSSSRGLRLLVSTGPRSRSYEYDDLQHGLFTYYLIDGIKGAAARADGLITFGGLASYVTRKVKDRNPNQAPYTDGQSTGEFPFAGTPKTPASAPPANSVTPPAPTLDLDTERYQAAKDARDPELLEKIASEIHRSDLADILRTKAAALRSQEGPERSTVGPKSETLASLRKRADDLDEQKRYAEALPLYRQLADAQDPWGQYKLGRYYRGDRGIPADRTLAESLYRKSAEAGEPFGINGLGVCYDNGWGVSRDTRVAVSWFRKAADLGNSIAMTNLARHYANGDGIPRDDAQALSLFKKAADLGYVPAMTGLGQMFEHGQGVAQDQAQAALWYRKAADLGDAAGMNELGRHYANIAKDDPQAVFWFRKAADVGFPAAMANLGHHYASGRGVAKDETQAAAWYAKSAELGYLPAIFDLANRYREGRGVAKDDFQAASWDRKAADLGYAGSMTNLGYMYETGRGVAQSAMEAVAWYRKGADAGDTTGMKNLANAYERGLGGRRDLVQAIEWYRKAAAAGNTDAQAALKRLHK